jgi:hypothetical protein
MVKTGLAAAAPPDTYIRIASRSGLARNSIDVGAGVVDADYRGEIQALIINNSTQPFTIRIGDRIAQLILERIVMANPTTEVSLTSTRRGARGFGSMGITTLLSKANISTLKANQFHQDFLNQVRTTSLADPAYQEWVSHPDTKKEIAVQDGLIYIRNRLYIPDNEPLRLQIAESEHDSQVAGHFGQKKTLELITRNFYWPSMEDWVNQYVRSCDECQRNKSPCHARY